MAPIEGLSDSSFAYPSYDHGDEDIGVADVSCTRDEAVATEEPVEPAWDEPAPDSGDAGLNGGVSSAAFGTLGAMGREGAVTGLMDRAYEAGRTAPQEPFSGTVYRAVGQPAHEATALDHRYGNPGRYNAAGERMIYTSPDIHSVALEAGAYAKPGEPAMAGRSLIALDYQAVPDAEGRGGVANLREGLRNVGLPVDALTDAKGAKSPSWLYLLTGEHPYSLGQQAGKGAADAGASALRGPAATGAADQIDLIPRNTDPSQLKASTVLRFGADGVPGLTEPAPHVAALPANDKAFTEGPLDKQAGRSGPNAAHQAPEKPAPTLWERASQAARGTPDGAQRANSGRYGAAGGAALSLGADAWAAAHGQDVDLVASGASATTAAAMGYGAARGADLLTPRLGLRGAGGAVAGIVEGAVSTGTNAQAYRRGEVTAARATANIVVDTTTAMAAGATGAGVGAMVGTAIPVPVVGTAVGAVVGFVVGAGAYVAVKYAGEASGALDAAKVRLSTALAGAEKPLGQALTQVGKGLDAASSTASKAWNAVKFW